MYMTYNGYYLRKKGKSPKCSLAPPYNIVYTLYNFWLELVYYFMYKGTKTACCKKSLRPIRKSEAALICNK